MGIRTDFRNPTQLRKISIPDLIRFAMELGATETGGPLSPSEQGVVRETMSVPKPTQEELALVRELVHQGQDPLGQAFIDALSPADRRPLGAVYTPSSLVESMVAWVLAQNPARVVDAGCGSGRYAMAVARANPDVDVVAVDLDPVATLVCRANAALLGAWQVQVMQADYTRLQLPDIMAQTAYVGNPPYVRHHEIPGAVKAQAKAAAKQFDLSMSALAGLHVHFYLATARYSRPGDIGCFVTSAEWLDVGYGSLVRKLLAGRLGAKSLHLLDPESQPFEDAMTTALIACFEVGNASGRVRFRFVPDGEPLGDLSQGGHEILRAQVAKTSRWSPLFTLGKQVAREVPEDDKAFVRLGSLVRVSRGVATGSNEFFVMTAAEAERRGLTRYTRPAVTAAKEIIASPGIIHATQERKVVIDLPRYLDLDATDMALVRAFVREGEELKVHERYLCAHRKPWWRLGIGEAPRVVATYMARQAPVFALNPDGLVLLNIAHGFYPRVPMTDTELLALVRYLNDARESYRGEGRTYHGGLEKFEPKEMESLYVPSLQRLRAIAEEL